MKKQKIQTLILNTYLQRKFDLHQLKQNLSHVQYTKHVQQSLNLHNIKFQAEFITNKRCNNKFP